VYGAIGGVCVASMLAFVKFGSLRGVFLALMVGAIGMAGFALLSHGVVG